MGAGERSLDQVLDSLDRRVARVEALLQLKPLVERSEDVEVEAEAVVGPTQPPTFQPTPIRPLRAQPPPLPAVQLPSSPPPAMFPPPPPRPVIPAYVSRRPAPTPRPQGELEQTIGLKWAGWIGAVVVVVGVALGIKYAYDQHWFEILPPGGRLAMMSLAAFALIGAGEAVYRRIHVFAAACLYGAGVATLFLVSYAGFGYYRLYEQQTAFLLMARSTVAGAAVAMRGNFVSIAVLAQIGGNLAPILLRSDYPRLVPFLTYLLTLQVVSLFLAWWGGLTKWWTLRGLSLATMSFWLLAVLNQPAFADSPTAKLTFCLVYAALFQAELIFSAVRGAVVRVSTEPPRPPPALGITPTAKRGVTFSMLVTALLTLAVLWIVRDQSHAARGAWVMALSSACAALGFVLTNDRSDARHNLGVGFRIQAAALLVVAVPVALAGISIILGWAVLAIAFAVLGKALDLRVSRWAGAVVWLLAVGYLGWWTNDLFESDHRRQAHAVWLHFLGAGVPAYTVIAWVLACAGHVVALLIRPLRAETPQPSDRALRDLSLWTGGFAGAVWVIASMAALPPAGATFAILVYAWLLLAADVAAPRLGLVLQSGAVVALAMIKWLAVDTLADRLSPEWTAVARTPFFNAVMGVGMLLSLTMGAMYWLRRDVLWDALTRRARIGRPADTVSAAAPAITLAAAVFFIMTVGLSFEIDRVVQTAAPGRFAWAAGQLCHLAWTVLWTLAACAFIALARRLEPSERLRPGLVRWAERFTLVLAVKYLVVDTLSFRAMHGPALAAPVVNLQCFTAMVVVAGMILVSYLMAREKKAEGDLDDGTAAARTAFAVAGFLAVLVVLWAGTLEIDRAFERLIAAGTSAFRDPALARQVAFSIFWSVFAVSSVVAGFRFRTAGLRYFGLGLFAVTLAKVVLLDMSQVQTGYRVLSFLGLGLLLMGTSVLYGKLSPVLLGRREPVVQ